MSPRTTSNQATAPIKLVLDQPPRGAGYRVNVDAFWLARFARPQHPVEHLYDLGAGVGAVGLALVCEGAADHATFIEVDPLAAAFARRNAAANGVDGRVDVIEGDVLEIARSRRGDASLVVCNPPYVEPGRGRPPTGAARARARMGELHRFVEAARLVAGRRGKAAFVYPASELVTLLEMLRKYGLEPKRLAFVQPSTSAPARVVMVEAQAAKAGGLLVLPPIIER